MHSAQSPGSQPQGEATREQNTDQISKEDNYNYSYNYLNMQLKVWSSKSWSI